MPGWKDGRMDGWMVFGEVVDAGEEKVGEKNEDDGEEQKKKRKDGRKKEAVTRW